jgi:hypothetical protein
MTRYWYDWEFLEDGHTIEPISIGIVADDGREYYSVFADAPWPRIRQHQWLMANVVPNLFTDGARSLPREEIAHEVLEFLRHGTEPELWGWYSSYDHVSLAHLYGPMISWPGWIPMWTNDVRQWQHQLGVNAMPVQAAGRHNALADARHTKVMWEYLNEIHTEAIRLLGTVEETA